MTEDYDDFIGIYAGSISREDCVSIIAATDRFFETSPPQNITEGAAQTPFLEFTRLDYSLNATVHLPDAAKIVEHAL
jgi:hypothetical protein